MFSAFWAEALSFVLSTWTSMYFSYIYITSQYSGYDTDSIGFIVSLLRSRQQTMH